MPQAPGEVTEGDAELDRSGGLTLDDIDALLARADADNKAIMPFRERRKHEAHRQLRKRMNGDEERELMRDIASYLVRTSEQRKVMRRELSDKWCMSVQHLDAFERRNRGTITAIESEIMRGGDIRFAGLWMARQEARIAAYQQAYEELGSELMMSLESRDDDGTEYGSHFEQIRTRSDIRKVRMQILRAVAEELGQLPPRQTVVVVPVQHVVVGVDVEALK